MSELKSHKDQDISTVTQNANETKSFLINPDQTEHMSSSNANGT